jgi:predicted nucleotidyltransferase
MHGLVKVAATMGIDERTLRRAVARGAVRGIRGNDGTKISDEEHEYLREHWRLISDLQRAFRTEPNVRLAVLYGSAARGEDGEGSDIDVLVSFQHEEGADTVRLATALRRRLGREVDVVSLDRIERRSPLLLLQVINEGRAIADRDGMWAEVRARRDAVRQRARRARRTQRDRTAAAMSDWLAGA